MRGHYKQIGKVFVGNVANLRPGRWVAQLERTTGAGDAEDSPSRNDSAERGASNCHRAYEY